MRVDVDEARRDREALGIDLLAPGAVNAADRGDAAVLHGNIGLARRTARAVEHGAVAHDKIELSGQGITPFQTMRCGPSTLPPANAPRKRPVRHGRPTRRIAP